MGNAATKEARPSGLRHGQSRTYHDADSSRGGGSQERSFLGLSSMDRGTSSSEPRRETRQEREARKREKERAARIKERERSMKTEHVDGGYLVTQGVYVGTEDFNKPIVRQLMIERRIAPFWRGLQDFSSSWAEHQIMAAARGLPIPPADEVPPELEYKAPPPVSQEDRQSDKFLSALTVPITSRSQSFNSDSSAGARMTSPQPQSPAGANTSGSQLFRGRAKTLASLTTSSKSNANMAPREFQLPHDPFVNGQPIEVYLYKDPMECPICFLYYPPYLNKTRCCDQPICSECFVQIKRADPHPPEHEQPGANPPRESESQTNESEQQLVTEPAACPFCVQPEFGVTYAQPPFRRGLAYAPGHGQHHLATVASPMSSSSSLNSANASPGTTTTTRRRATSLSADAPGVITTDKIRPDWAQKLATARANAARRSAAATALHTAAYLMNNNSNNNNSNSTPSSNSESRNLANIGRRALLRRGTGNDSPTARNNSTHVNAFAYLAERRAAERIDGDEQSNSPARGNASRRERSRAEEIEEMMIMEAIRLSLTTEEERRKKEEKEAKKEAKKREKEAKRGGKSAAQNEETSSTNESSNSALNLATHGLAASPDAGPSADNIPSQDKGKGVAHLAPADQGEPSSSSQTAEKPPKLTLNTPLAGESSTQAGTSPSPKPHLRSQSSASSSDISLVESAFDDQKDTGTPNGSAPNIDAVFNFRSLAAMVGDAENERTETSSQPVPVPVSNQAGDSGTCDRQRESPRADDHSFEGKEAQSRSTEISSQSPIS